MRHCKLQSDIFQKQKVYENRTFRPRVMNGHLEYINVHMNHNIL